MMNREEVLSDLLSVWQCAQLEGRDVPASELCRDHPELLPQLQGRIEALRQMNHLLQGIDQQTLSGLGAQSTSPEQTLAASGAASSCAVIPVPVAVQLAGYEILGELGRGGMGVVYQARQTRLNRVVALKMLLAGNHAGPEELARFRTEAEAVARLQHPNIVQVFEVGEHEGRPYFSLEFCPGGSLDRKLAGSPLPAEEAARLVELLARAVQSAHQANVIHRDLKPANVLLAAGGIPKITDFGLAKKLDQAGLTQTGAVMGTPSYMAPEQAEGKKEIGPAADIYALGSILYECLTGRPPFKAASLYDTMMQVIHQEPVSPRQLNAQVPIDLETISLKCLQKDPAKRYASCQELADDLRRWQNGEAIQARRQGLGERLGRWVRKNPVVAGLSAAILLLILSATGLITWQWQHAMAALDRAEREQKQRALAQLNDLRDAAPGAVPAILADLQANRDSILPRLRELWQQQDLAPAARMRLALALLPVEPQAVRGPLLDWMLQADDPAEVLLVRDALLPQSADLNETLWRRAEDDKAPAAERFRALAALARFDPGNTRWVEAGGRKPSGLADRRACALPLQAALVAVEQMLSANPLHLGLWVAGLRPVREALLGPLGEVFRGQRLPDLRLTAATVLADYAADQPEVLSQLLLDAEPKQYALLRPVLEKHSAAAARYMRDVLKQTVLPDWQDPPLPAAWREPAGELRQELERAGGLLGPRWALCQRLPLDRLAALTEGLGGSGYRPVRVRPYRIGAERFAAVVWTRDGRAWKVESDLDAAAVQERDAHWQKAGLRAADLAGYPAGARMRYAALWVQADKEEQTRLVVGVSSAGHKAELELANKAGHIPLTLQGVSDAAGVVRYSMVWSKRSPGAFAPAEHRRAATPGSPVHWNITWGRTLPVLTARVQDTSRLLVDLDSVSGSAIWDTEPGRQGEAVLGLAPADHLARCRDLAARGWRPVVVSTTMPPNGGSTVASVWHRPLPSRPQEERLAQKQAQAAATLLHLGQADLVWPLFRLSPDPELRSQLIWHTGLLAVDPRLLVQRLEQEKDVSARRALIVSLGEHTAEQLPAEVRQPLTSKLLHWYRHDPDPGIHGAIDWLLRHDREGPNPRPLDWKQAQQLRQLDEELKRPPGGALGRLRPPKMPPLAAPLTRIVAGTSTSRGKRWSWCRGRSSSSWGPHPPSRDAWIRRCCTGGRSIGTLPLPASR